MSIELIESEISRFLSSEELEVMCITGHWGVGKTFAWNKYLKDAQARGSIALKRYSYVSLFGINSLDELKYSIFENSVKSSEIGIEPSIETLRSNTSAATERLGRKALWFVQQIPLVKNYAGGLAPVWYLSVKGTIVCIDDIERRGNNLSIRDVLGLISSLKEQKKCKVVLILNDEAMEKEKDEFTTYFEKVVDTSLKFAPSPRESVRIALALDSPTNTKIAEYCVTLGISNIRLIKKIQRAVGKLEPMLKNFDAEVLTQSVHSLVLLVWSVYEPARAPSLEYLRTKRGKSFLGAKEGTIPPNEASWNALLDVYGFGAMDEFDLTLLDGVQKGFFDPVLVNDHAMHLESQIKTGKLNNSFLEAWRQYHDSFDNNQDAILDAIYQSFLNDIDNISPVSLAGTMDLFKKLGRERQAAELLQLYTRNRRSHRRLFDLTSYPFAGEITDPDIIKAFKERYAEFKDERSVAAILLDMAIKNGWNDEDISLLANSTVDQYYKAFKDTKGGELRDIINSSLQFDRFGNASAEWKEISTRAKEALRRIGRESALNAHRVKKYGVNVD